MRLSNEMERKARWRRGCRKGGQTRDFFSCWILKIMIRGHSSLNRVMVLHGTGTSFRTGLSRPALHPQLCEAGLCRLRLGRLAG